MPKGTHRFREEVINVQLAAMLAARGLEANAETIDTAARPDVLIDLEGLKLVLEGRSKLRRASLMRDARDRVTLGIADISIAILYPEGLQSARSMQALARKIEGERYDGAIGYMGRTGLKTIPFEAVGIDELVEMINSVFRLRVENEVVREQVTSLHRTIESVVDQASATHLFFSSEAVVARLKQALGVDPNAADQQADGD